MKSAILLLAVFAAAFSSCTTAYKTGQTPDDVYYSPVKPQQDQEYVQKEDSRENTYSDEAYDDRYLRMKVRNRYRWNTLNDWYYYDRYSYGYNYYYGSYNNPYNAWNYYYNLYCCCHSNNMNMYSNPKVAFIKPEAKPHNFNLGGYTNNTYSNTNSGTGSKRVYTNTNTNNNNNNSNGLSKTIRTIFERSNNNNSSSGSNSNSSSSPSRTYTPSSSSPSSSSPSSGSSGGSSGGGVTRPVRN